MTDNDIDPTMTVLFEVFGPGSVYTIDTDPPTDRVQDVALPWHLELEISRSTAMLQVVAVGKDDPGPGCRITIDGVVVSEQPQGGSAHCIWTA
ncbi:MAG: MmpS family protein [Actinomycetota bacterium]|nr:MmpS family protein [Actinomycetota bacterium]